jgi:hypothetical protein
MFIGHFAVGFAAKRWAPRVPLALLVLAPLLADVLWPIFLLAGIEHAHIVPGPNPFLMLRLDDMPWSHSLVMDVIWAVALGLLVARGARPEGRRAGLVIGMLVLSHWVLDWVTHQPDMALWPGGPKYGLALWESVAWTMIVESAMFIAGVAAYLGATRARSWAGHVSWWSLVAVLALAYATQPVTPPPPGMAAVAVMALILSALTMAWCLWIERTRPAREGQ